MTSLTIEVDNLTTGQTSLGSNALNVSAGDTLRVTGIVSPDPRLSAGDLEVEVIPTGPNPPFSPTTLGVLSGGYYEGGTFPIYSDTRSFSIQAKYLPTGSLSPVVNVTTPVGTSPPPVNYISITIFVGNVQTMIGIIATLILSDLSGNPYGTLVTDSLGFVSTSLPVGSYKLNVSSAGYVTANSTIQVAIGISNSYTVTLSPVSTPPPPPTVSYNCVSGNCVQVQGSGGQFATLAECQANCGSGTPPPPTGGTNYELLAIAAGLIILIVALALSVGW